MKTIKTLILRTAGTNCDIETAHAFKEAGSDPELLHINALIKDKKVLKKYQILAIPGGFTYGDDIASGRILANELRHSLGGPLSDFINSGKLVIGICNGFQVLVKMGLLPNTQGLSSDQKIEATLSFNNSGKFEDRWVYLVREQSVEHGGQKGLCVWTTDLPRIIYLPVAHGEGKFIPKDHTVLEKLRKAGQIVFRYTDEKGDPSGYPANPNGSIGDIAGISDTTGRVLGMMPHPERHITFLQHPKWQSLPEKRKEMGVGLHIFKNGVNFLGN